MVKLYQRGSFAKIMRGWFPQFPRDKMRELNKHVQREIRTCETTDDFIVLENESYLRHVWAECDREVFEGSRSVGFIGDYIIPVEDVGDLQIRVVMLVSADGPGAIEFIVEATAPGASTLQRRLVSTIGLQKAAEYWPRKIAEKLRVAEHYLREAERGYNDALKASYEGGIGLRRLLAEVGPAEAVEGAGAGSKA